MEPTIDNTNENEPIIDKVIDQTEDVAEIDVDMAEAAERPHGRGRGRHGKRDRRAFGPNRPYRFALFVDEEGGYVLRSPDLAERSTKIESLDGLGAAMQCAIDERAAEDAAAAAEAEKDAQFSGKFVLRLPRSMHRQLTELAEAEGVSLNQLARGFLAESMGRAEMIHEFGERRGKHRGPRGGGRGPEGHGHGDRDPWGRGPRGDRARDPERHDPERDFGGRSDWNDRRPRGRPGCGPQGRGFRRRRWLTGAASDRNAAPASPETNGAPFV